MPEIDRDETNDDRWWLTPEEAEAGGNPQLGARQVPRPPPQAQTTTSPRPHANRTGEGAIPFPHHSIGQRPAEWKRPINSLTFCRHCAATSPRMLFRGASTCIL